MAGPSEQDPRGGPPPSGLADPTRDIRLPPLPGTAGPALPSEWEALREAPATRSHDNSSVDQPTDQLGQPPEGARDRTLTFDGSAAERWAAGLPSTPDPAWSSVPAGSRPVVGARPRPAEERSRRWPWIVLILVPVLVIVVTGVWLLVLMQGG